MSKPNRPHAPPSADPTAALRYFAGMAPTGEPTTLGATIPSDEFTGLLVRAGLIERDGESYSPTVKGLAVATSAKAPGRKSLYDARFQLRTHLVAMAGTPKGRATVARMFDKL